MATDALTVVQASVVKTATFSGTGLDLGTRSPTYGLVVRVLYSAAANASGANSVTFTVDHSADNTNWTTCAGGPFANIINLTTTPQAGEIFIPFETTQRFVRLTATVAGAGTVPTITYQGDLTMALPA